MDSHSQLSNPTLDANLWVARFTRQECLVDAGMNKELAVKVRARLKFTERSSWTCCSVSGTWKQFQFTFRATLWLRLGRLSPWPLSLSKSLRFLDRNWGLLTDTDHSKPDLGLMQIFLTFHLSNFAHCQTTQIQFSVRSQCHLTSDLFSPSTGLMFWSSCWLGIINAVAAACSFQLLLCWRLSQSAASLCAVFALCVRVCSKEKWEVQFTVFFLISFTNLHTQRVVKWQPEWCYSQACNKPLEGDLWSPSRQNERMHFPFFYVSFQNLCT